jgi:hypothetical protein
VTVPLANAIAGLVLALAVHHLWLRPRLARRLLNPLARLMRRRLRSMRRSLDALDRVANFHPYRPRHPRRIP